MSMTSLPDNYRAAIFGASGAIGAAFVKALNEDSRCAIIHAGARRPLNPPSSKIRPFQFDLEDEHSIASAAKSISTEEPLNLVIVATGLLHADALQPEKTWRSLSGDALNRSIAINATGPALIAKHMLEHLQADQKSIFAALSARVGSIRDNHLGGWYSYRASKAALNMLIRCCAIELARRAPKAVCVCLHPGTVDSTLSKPFQRGVPNLFTPIQSANQMLDVLNRLTAEDSGGLFDYDGAHIPF